MRSLAFTTGEEERFPPTLGHLPSPEAVSYTPPFAWLGLACLGLVCLHQKSEREALAWLALPWPAFARLDQKDKGEVLAWRGLTYLDLTWLSFLNLR